MQFLPLFFYALFSSVYLQAVEYIYPLAVLDDEKTVLVMDQISSSERELLLWNSCSKQAESCLWSLYNPEQVTMLPDGTAFSFIYNGRMRIKPFQKRSAKTIDFDKPIYSFNSIHWINNDFCYCSAQSDECHALFQLCTDGTLCCIASRKDKDCLYPQKIDDHLFYIERSWNNASKNYSYAIMQTQYPVIIHEKNSTDEYECINAAHEATVLIDFFDKPIVFLQMKSPHLGFVLEYNQQVNDDATITFQYHQLFQENNLWHSKKLFSFAIPSYLLLPTDKRHLHELLVPFIPLAEGTAIYFVDCMRNTEAILEPYCCDLVSGAIEPMIYVTKSARHAFFVPVACGKNFFIGGSVDDSKGLVKKWNDKKRGLCIDVGKC